MFIAKFNFGVVEKEDLIQTPSSQLLAYPNPFSNQTTISYEAQKAENIRVSIFNLRGQEVFVLYEGANSTEQLNLSWNGADAKGDRLPAGIYFARAQTRFGSKTVKVLKY
jgi:flagellar hook assembly protein FlgD